MVVAADARLDFARHHGRPAAHRLDRVPSRVDRLEVDRCVRRNQESCRAIGIDRHRSQNPFHIPGALDGNRSADQRASGRSAIAVAAHAGRTILQSDDANCGDGAPLDPRQAQPLVDILHEDRPGRLAVIDHAGPGRGAGARAHRDRLIAVVGRVAGQQLAPSILVDVVDAELALAVRLEADQELLLVQRIGVQELITRLSVAVDMLGGRVPHRSDQLGAQILLTALSRVDDPQPAFLSRVVPGEDRDVLAGSRDGTGVDQRGREVRVVPVQSPLAGAVGVHLEQPLRVDLPSVVVVPACVDDSPITRDGRKVGVHLVETDLSHEPAVAVA